MTKNKLILFLISNLFLITNLLGQGFACNYKWSPSTIGIDATKLPSVTDLETEFPSTILFRVIFSDIDAKKAIVSTTCPASGIGYAQATTASYEVKFSITQAKEYSTFNSNLTLVDITKTIIVNYDNIIGVEVIPDGSGGTIEKRIYEAFVSLNIRDLWAIPANQKDKITLKYTLKDVSTLPIGDTGDLKDAEVSGNWTISFKHKDCPKKMISLPGNPADSTWYAPLAHKYYYAVGPDTNYVVGMDTNYVGKIINEKLTGPLAAGMFTLADMEPKWLVDKPGFDTEEKIVREIFSPAFGNPHSWIIEKGTKHNNQFNGTDEHGGFDDAKAYDYFTAAALIKGVAGFKIDQQFTCNNNTFGRAEIFKRLRQIGSGSPFQEYKKNHSF